MIFVGEFGDIQKLQILYDFIIILFFISQAYTEVCTPVTLVTVVYLLLENYIPTL